METESCWGRLDDTSAQQALDVVHEVAGACRGAIFLAHCPVAVV